MKPQYSFSQAKPPLSPGLRLIAVFKLVQGLLLALLGTGFWMLISRDADAQATHWLGALRIDINGHFTRSLLNKVDAINPLHFKRLSLGAFLYAGMLMTEGTGLLLQKWWAEYLTVVVTGSFLPLELYEVTRHFSVTTLVILAANLAVVWYLVKILLDKHRQKDLRSASGETSDNRS